MLLRKRSGKGWGIWFILCILQVMVLIFYLVFYFYAMLLIWSVLYRNNDLVGSNEWVGRVECIDESGDNSYAVRVSALLTVEIEVSFGDRVCTVMNEGDGYTG